MHLCCNFQTVLKRAAFLECESIPPSCLHAILWCQIQWNTVSVGKSPWFLCHWQWRGVNFQLLTLNSQQKWRKLQQVLFLIGPCHWSQCAQKGFIAGCLPAAAASGCWAACELLTRHLLSTCWCCAVEFGLPCSPANLHPDCFSRLR